MANKKIGVIIVTYNNVCNTLCAIDSVLRSDYKNIDIVIVDNASSSIYREKLQNACEERFLSVTVLCLEKESGYGAACNVGARHVIERGSNALLILNNDVVLHENCISYLMMNLDENVVLVGPKVYFGFSNIIASAGADINKTFMIVKNRGGGEADNGRYDKREKVEFITGCVFLISAKAFIDLNGFDEKFYYYYDETDLCYRATKAGYIIIYEPKAIVYHWSSTTLGGESKRTLYYMTRSGLYFVRKHNKNKTALFSHLIYIFYMFIIKLTYARLGQIITRYLAVIRGIRDFFVGITWKAPYDKY